MLLNLTSSVRHLDHSVAGSAAFQASLRLCNTASKSCHLRVYNLPVSGTWASACDTLGDLIGSAGAGVEVEHFWYWVSDASGQPGSEAVVPMYDDVYCGGNPIEYDTSTHGAFQATRNPSTGARSWALHKMHAVRSVRVTALGAYQDNATSVGVKLVVFPLYNLDAQLKTWDEFTCDKGGYHDVWLPSGQGWPGTCASPIDRVYCISRTPSDSNWGAVDDWPTYGFDFADNWELPCGCVTRGCPGGCKQNFLGRFPMGSATINTYTSSWTGHAPCTDPRTSDPFAPLPAGTCIVVKLYEQSCPNVTRGNISSWRTVTPTYTLRQLGRAGCVNSGGPSMPGSACSNPTGSASGPWPQPIRCAWARVVDGEECEG